MAKYLIQTGGGLAEATPTTTSAGAADAGKLIQTGSDGLLDLSFMPSGIGPATEPVQASEALAAGALVNFHAVSGAARARNADASTGKPADGYVLSSVASGQQATVYRSGRNTMLTGLTVGEQFLSTTPGAVTATPPSGSGQTVQRVGYATGATQLSFARGIHITLA